MTIRTALLIAAAIVIAMFAFDRVMIASMNRWADQTVAISSSQRILTGIAVLWDHFWWILTPIIFGFMLTASLLTNRPGKRA